LPEEVAIMLLENQHIVLLEWLTFVSGGVVFLCLFRLGSRADRRFRPVAEFSPLVLMVLFLCLFYNGYRQQLLPSFSCINNPSGASYVHPEKRAIIRYLAPDKTEQEDVPTLGESMRRPDLPLKLSAPFAPDPAPARPETYQATLDRLGVARTTGAGISLSLLQETAPK
jgi:hypothetical protein